MLVMTEKILKSSKGSILTVKQTSFKKKSTRKNKKFAKKQKVENKPKKKVSKKKAVKKKKYFHYNMDGHWKHNYYPSCWRA